MSLKTAAVLCALAMALAGCSRGAPDLLDAIAPTSGMAFDEEAAAASVSRYRAKHGLGPVVIDPRLIRAASLQAASNARIGRLSHESGGAFGDRMAAAGFAKGYTAENLSAGSENFDQVLDRWKASPQHNRNMLIPQMTRVGMASVDAPGTRYKRYWALVLASD